MVLGIWKLWGWQEGQLWLAALSDRASITDCFLLNWRLLKQGLWLHQDNRAMHKSNTKKIKVKVLLQTEEMAPTGRKCSIRKHEDPSLVLMGEVMHDYNLSAGRQRQDFWGFLASQPSPVANVKPCPERHLRRTPRLTSNLHTNTLTCAPTHTKREEASLQ